MSNFLTSSSLKLDTEIVEATKQQFLRFSLDPEVRVMLPIAQITEVLKIQCGQIVPIPHLPAWVMGVYNWRGEILWMVNLGHLLGRNYWTRRERSSPVVASTISLKDCSVVVLSPANDIYLGLVVYRVEDIEECELTEVRAIANETAAEIAEFASRYWQKSATEMVAVLDGDAIARAMPTSTDPIAF